MGFLGQKGYWRGGHRVFPTLKEGFENFVPSGTDPVFDGCIGLFSKILLFGIIIGMIRECAGCGSGTGKESVVYQNTDARVELSYYKVDTVSNMVAGRLEFDWGFQKFKDERIYYDMDQEFTGTIDGNTLNITLLSDTDVPMIESSDGGKYLVDPNMVIGLQSGSSITLMGQTMVKVE